MKLLAVNIPIVVSVIEESKKRYRAHTLCSRAAGRHVKTDRTIYNVDAIICPTPIP